MGASQPPRNNPFKAQGLEAGLTIRVEAMVGRQVQTYATVLDEVEDETLRVLVPMHRLQPHPFPSGPILHCEYFFRDRRWRFATEAQPWSPGTDVQYLAHPAGIEDADRRDYFRLHTALKPISVYRVLLDTENLASAAPPALELTCTVVDLSEGGLCLSSRTPAAVGEWLGIHAELPQAGELKARMRVVSVSEPSYGNRNYRIHCVFADITLAERDKIARFLMRRQLEMRRLGQL